jgi:hypothetical protein
VFERRAPSTLPIVEAHIAPRTVRQGNVLHVIDEALLEMLTRAYREAAGSRLTDADPGT